MSLPARILPRLWLIVPILAFGFLVWSHAVRLRHIEHASSLAGGAALVEDPASPTGFANGVRRLILAENQAASIPSILETQGMLARGEWRVRHVDYDNAPHGRDVRTPSLYRWWLATVAWLDSALTGRPAGAAVEGAALLADPIAHGLLFIVVVLMLAGGCGPAAAALGSIVLACAFPLAAGFFPGQPDGQGLVMVFALMSVLPLALALQGQPASGAPRVRPGHFIIAGVAGGLGLWIEATIFLPLLAGLALGGMAAVWVHGRGAAAGRDREPNVFAWRAWAIAGAATSLMAWLLEYAPAQLNLGPAYLENNHPLHALAWLGLGEVGASVEVGLRSGRRAWRPWRVGAIVAGAGAVLAIPVLRIAGGRPVLFETDAAAMRLSDLPGGALAANLPEWFAREGFSLGFVAAWLPVLAAGVLVWICLRGRGAAGSAAAGCAFAAVPLLVLLALANVHLRLWGVVDGLVLAVVVAVLGFARENRVLVVAAVIVVCGCLPGFVLLARESGRVRGDAVTRAEVQALLERDLAHWLASQAPEPGAIVLAPPELTMTLAHYGGLRGLGSPYRGNEDGFRASVLIAGATSMDEAHALVESRGVRYVVVPTWDTFMDEYAKLGSKQPDTSLVALLHQWLPPRWLRAVPYQMPAVEGFEGESVVIFEVVELQDNPTALSRLAEYFLEVGQVTNARRLAAALKELYPTEPAAFIARAHVAVAVRDAGGFREIIEALLPMLEDGSAEVLTWDRRVSLALVLAQAKRTEVARIEAQRCLDEMDEIALRTLTNLSLQRFLGLADSLDLEFADPDLQALAVRLLPPEMRQN